MSNMVENNRTNSGVGEIHIFEHHPWLKMELRALDRERMYYFSDNEIVHIQNSPEDNPSVIKNTPETVALVKSLKAAGKYVTTIHNHPIEKGNSEIDKPPSHLDVATLLGYLQDCSIVLTQNGMYVLRRTDKNVFDDLEYSERLILDWRKRMDTVVDRILDERYPISLDEIIRNSPQWKAKRRQTWADIDAFEPFKDYLCFRALKHIAHISMTAMDRYLYWEWIPDNGIGVFEHSDKVYSLEFANYCKRMGKWETIKEVDTYILALIAEVR